MELGYDGKLYILAFDHRGSFQKKMFGIEGDPTEEAMRATEDIADEVRRGAAEAGSGSDQGPEYFEVPIDTMA